MKKLLTAINSTIIGGAVGDALGVPFEFKPRGSFKATDMTGYGTYNLPPGTWSDDTSMTLCLVEALTENNGDKADPSGLYLLMNKFVDWHQKGYLTPYKECFDIGRTTLYALADFKRGKHPHRCGGKDDYSNGNGSLMRIAPVVFLCLGVEDFKLRVKLVEKYSEVTHAHPRSILGCIIYIEYLRQLFSEKSKQKALTNVMDIINFQLTDIQYIAEKKYYIKILSGSIVNFDKDDISSDGYVVSTLTAALWCFLKNENYKDVVLEAVNLGNDTDTTAIVAGSIAGLYYGFGKNGIPKKWINSLARIDDIKLICEKFYHKLIQTKN